MLKIGVFGAGPLGKSHIEHWKEIPGIKLTGFYDPDDSNAATVIEQYDIKRYTDADELINMADVADIVSATATHFEIAKKCLLNQKHILIEKPLTHSLEEASELVKIVNEANVKCQVGYIERYNPALLASSSRILQPMFIEAHRLAKSSLQSSDISVVMDLMIHDIDIILHLVRSPVRRISANGVSVISETTDIVNARIEFDNGCVANLTSSRISLNNTQQMSIFQHDACINIDFLEGKAEVLSLKELDGETDMTNSMLQLPGNNSKAISVDTTVVKASNAIKMQLEEFADAVLNDRPVRVNVYDGYQAMDVAQQVLKKMSLHNELHNV